MGRGTREWGSNESGLIGGKRSLGEQKRKKMGKLDKKKKTNKCF